MKQIIFVKWFIQGGNTWRG